MKRDRRIGSAATQPGLTVASYGRRIVVEDEHGDTHSCLVKGRRLRVVCGDNVTFVRDPHGNVITEINPRDNALTRPDRRGRDEVLAANLTRLLVVVAPRPEPDPFMTDRYLAAAEVMGVNAVLVYNKSDLAGTEHDGWLSELEQVGYPLVRTQALTGEGIDELRSHCRDGVSILVGLSGVGKSSLLNALAPELELRTDAVSKSSGEGRHTTTASVMHTLPGGGRVIDSPGVRDFAPGLLALGDVDTGYREIAALASQCRFHNCLHFEEPGCAVREALEAGRISERRYASYRRLLNLMRRLGKDRQP